MNDPDELYHDREQTLVKHTVLRKYLERFAHKVGSAYRSIAYVDCFSGPWNEISQDFKDCSFSIALEELLKARDALKIRGKRLKIRCLFLEDDSEAFRKLTVFTDAINDTDVTVVTRNNKFENSINEIQTFIRSEASSFPFIFIDPTGWTGFKMSVIAPLLSIQPNEVLINFMTGHIIRFVEKMDPRYKESFDELFGDPNFREGLSGLEKQDREDAIVDKYKEMARKTGNFRFVLSAMVLMPEKERTHFHLVYATRIPEGVAVFKEVEKKAMEVGEIARAEAHSRQRESKGQRELFGSDNLSQSNRYNELRDRYTEKAKQLVESELKRSKTVLYDQIWILALEPFPLVWESDLKDWIADWVKMGFVKIEGLSPKQRVPNRGQNHSVTWCGT